MKRVVLAASLGLALVLPAVAIAHPPTPQHVRAYERAYHADQRIEGRTAPGRNIIRDGLASGRAVTDADVMASLAVLQRAIAPPPAPAPVPVAVTAAPVAAPVAAAPASYAASYSGGSSGALPSCTWVPESGGNWSAYNASSGAGGRYQILPSTWQAYGGTGSPQTASPAEQTTVAQRVYAGQGPSAWVNC